MSKKKVLLRGVFINRDTNGEGVLKVGTTLIRVSTVMGILYCQLVKNKIRVPSGTLILFPPHCLRHRCYLLMGYAPETPRQKDTPSTKGMVCLSVFTAIVPGNVADVYLDN